MKYESAAYEQTRLAANYGFFDRTVEQQGGLFEDSGPGAGLGLRTNSYWVDDRLRRLAPRSEEMRTRQHYLALFMRNEEGNAFTDVSAARSPASRYVVAVGLVPSGGQGGNTRLGVDVSRPVSVDDLSLGSDGLAREVTVHVVGRAVAHSANLRIRPPYPGLSVGHERGSAGTLGAFVHDGQTSYALSCGHVLAAGRHPRLGDSILQPGPSDGGGPGDTIAGLTQYTLLNPEFVNPHDIAVAEMNDPEDALRGLVNAQPALGPLLDEQVQAGAPVAKLGRSTGVTSGEVEQSGTIVRLWFGRRRLTFVNQISIASSTHPFSAPGDSGSVVWREDGLRPYAVIIGGSELRAYASPLAPFLSTMGFSLFS